MKYLLSLAILAAGCGYPPVQGIRVFPMEDPGFQAAFSRWLDAGREVSGRCMQEADRLRLLYDYEGWVCQLEPCSQHEGEEVCNLGCYKAQYGLDTLFDTDVRHPTIYIDSGQDSRTKCRVKAHEWTHWLHECNRMPTDFHHTDPIWDTPLDPMFCPEDDE